MVAAPSRTGGWRPDCANCTSSATTSRLPGPRTRCGCSTPSTSATLGNPEDMRFQLLDYCYGVVSRAAADDEGIAARPLPEDDPRRTVRLALRAARLQPPDRPGSPSSRSSRRSDTPSTSSSSAPKTRSPSSATATPGTGRTPTSATWPGSATSSGADGTSSGSAESAFYVDPAKALDAGVERLAELEIHPSGWAEHDLPQLDEGTQPHDGDIHLPPEGPSLSPISRPRTHKTTRTSPCPSTTCR